LRDLKKFVLTVLAIALLSVAGVAAAGGPYPYYPEYPGPPPYYYEEPAFHSFHSFHYPPPIYVPIPRDVRIQIAELEKLKADIQHHTLSVYPNDMSRAVWLAERMAFLNYAIEAWRLGYR
jgi:hypothetical protein